MNSVVVAIPPSVRTWVYLIYGLVGVLAGATQVGYATAEVTTPIWLKVGVAVYTFLGGAIGYTAATHTPAANNEVQNPRNEFGTAGLGLIFTVIGIVLIIVGILALLKVLAISLTVSILLLVIGLLLVVFGRAGTP